MVSNVTKNEILTRMAVFNEDAWPLLSVKPKLSADTNDRIGFTEFIMSGREVFSEVVHNIYDITKKQLGADIPAPN
ncbi:hypothetical protein [Methyloceanibacter sp.]|jgi:ribonuclease Z|uniref:hypothetical protein n=1 Tax=Methyloceanibacter sp. TaxID=1965321 RepID=UPI003C73A69A